MKRILVGMLMLFILVGCQAAKPLPYAAGEEGAARFIRADYVQIGSKIQVIIDSSAYQVQTASITRSNGQDIQPLAIQKPQQRQGDMSNLGGPGGGYIGSGRNTGATIGTTNAGNTVQTKTYVWFNMISLGDAPWTLKLNILGIGDLSIELPAKTMATEQQVTTPTPGN
jgi:hypothetical protein